MKRGYVLTCSAERDIEAIKLYLLEEASVQVAKRTLSELRRGLNFVAANPGAGHFREDLAGRELKFWNVLAYQIVYRFEVKPVIIVRILHAKRDVRAILSKSRLTS